jgi:hypothetical protein
MPPTAALALPALLELEAAAAAALCVVELLNADDILWLGETLPHVLVVRFDRERPNSGENESVFVLVYSRKVRNTHKREERKKKRALLYNTFFLPSTCDHQGGNRLHRKVFRSKKKKQNREKKGKFFSCAGDGGHDDRQNDAERSRSRALRRRCRGLLRSRPLTSRGAFLKVSSLEDQGSRKACATGSGAVVVVAAVAQSQEVVVEKRISGADSFHSFVLMTGRSPLGMRDRSLLMKMDDDACCCC